MAGKRFCIFKEGALELVRLLHLFDEVEEPSANTCTSFVVNCVQIKLRGLFDALKDIRVGFDLIMLLGIEHHRKLRMQLFHRKGNRWHRCADRRTPRRCIVKSVFFAYDVVLGLVEVNRLVDEVVDVE